MVSILMMVSSCWWYDIGKLKYTSKPVKSKRKYFLVNNLFCSVPLTWRSLEKKKKPKS